MTSTSATTRPRALSNRDRAHLALALREQRRFRLEQLTELARGNGRDATGGAEVSAALARGAAHALAEIEAALDRLRDGSYGACTVCRQPIARERLAVLPAAALCMGCQRVSDDTGAHERVPGDTRVRPAP